MAERIHVVAGVIRDGDGRVLVAQRPPGAHLAGLWEFPGGKCEAGESPYAALVRELHEEIGIDVLRAERLIRVAHDYPEKSVLLDAWTVQEFRGLAQSNEGQPLRWVDLADLAAIAMPPADRPIVHALSLPREYLITPEPELGQEAVFLAQLERAVANGIRLIQVRIKTFPASQAADLLLAGRSIAHAAGAQLLLNGDFELSEQLDLAGVHLPASMLRKLVQRPLPLSRWVGASCHDAEEIALARSLGADFITLSPVVATASHPVTPAIGWEHFERLVAGAGLPVFALGGMTAADLATARNKGGQGIAAMRAFWPSSVDSYAAGASASAR